MRGCNKAEKSRPPEGIFKIYIPNFNFLAQFGAEIGEEQLFFKVTKETFPPLISPLLIDLGG